MRAQSLDQEDTLEKGTARNSIILAWRIPRTEEPGGLQSIGSQRVGQDWSDLACTNTHCSLFTIRLSAVTSLCWQNPCGHTQDVCWEGETRHTEALRTCLNPEEMGFRWVLAQVSNVHSLAWAGWCVNAREENSQLSTSLAMLSTGASGLYLTRNVKLRREVDGEPQDKVIGDSFPVDWNPKIRRAAQFGEAAGPCPDHLFPRVRRPPWLHVCRDPWGVKGEWC